MTRPETPHRIVIVGGGAGGLELATGLGDTLGKRGRADITLIDKNRTHVWKPKLHEIAAGSMDMAAHEVDYLAQAHWHHFRYRIGEMMGLDRQRREVRVAPYLDAEGREVTPDRVFGYDTLVLAIGSLSNDFGTPGVDEHALKLESKADARRFHARMVNACIRAHAQTTPLRPEQLHVAIIGAGATGVELAAELHRTTREVVAFGLDRERREVQVAASHDEAGREVTPQRVFGYDTLVVAVGSLSNDFGTPGVREHAMRLETSADAQRFHSRLVSAVGRVNSQVAPVRPEQLAVAIIGAGATGVELAAELHRTTREVVAFGLDRVNAPTRP